MTKHFNIIGSSAEIVDGDNTILVAIDTNMFIRHLSYIENMLKNTYDNVKILLPHQVLLHELDKLKLSEHIPTQKEENEFCFHVREAIRFIRDLFLGATYKDRIRGNF